MHEALWSTIPGQAHAQRVLSAHIASGRVAHGYLFSGPDIGTLERIARVFACCVMAPQDDSAGKACDHIFDGSHPDLHIAEPSGAAEKIKIDDIRGIIQRVSMRPYNAQAQVVIVSHADRLTEEAANCLLKSLEEPSKHTFFCLLSTNARNCLPTIGSRCQLIRVSGAEDERVVAHLEGLSLDPEAGRLVVRLAGGNLQRAQALHEGGALEAWTSFPKEAAAWADRELPAGREPVRWFISALIEWARDIVLLKVSAPQNITHAYAESMLREQTESLCLEDVLGLIESLTELIEGVNRYASPKVAAAVAKEQWLRLFD